MPIRVQNAVQYAVAKWLDQDHPRVETGHCIAIKQRSIPCTACSDICPTGALLGPRDHDWDACIDCNLCVSVCPTRAIRTSADVTDRFLHALDTGAAEITFGCEFVGGDAYLKTYCLGGIPWEVFATCALDRDIICDLSRCKECEEHEGREQLLDTLERTAVFLGKKYFTEHIHLLTEGQEGTTSVNGFSRREALSFMRGVSKNVAENMLNRDQSTPIDGLFFRKELRSRLENPKPTDPERYGLTTITFNDTCWACNLCKNACPTHAISIEHDEEAREYDVVVSPILCVGCMLCKGVCRDDGIDEAITFRTEAPLTPLATPAHPSVCEECGRNFRPDGNTRCLRCIKAEERRVKAEEDRIAREQRAAERKAKREAELAEQKRAEEEAAKAAETGTAEEAEAKTATTEDMPKEG